MLSKETAGLIWTAYNEIEKGEKLLIEMDEAAKKYGVPPLSQSPFNNHRDLQLGVPASDVSRTMLYVRPELGLAVIKAHIAEKKALLETLNITAGLEIAAKSTGTP